VARNVEIKARLADPGAAQRRVESLADGPPEVLDQTDTFFSVAGGRLKLRETAGRGAELIFYERPDDPDPVESRYERVPVRDAPALRAVLAAALGIRGEVIKRRQLFRSGRTRIHLDEVRGLGTFLELEVELRDGAPAKAGQEEARRLLRALEIEPAALVAEAYVDLLGRVAGGSAGPGE
jgi:predicted adenylyl cyclase CyaB